MRRDDAFLRHRFRDILRSDFPAFLHKVFLELNPGAVFQPNWHIEAICYAVACLCATDSRENRLVINAPPRSLKSIICSVALPAFLLGQNPALQIICASYSAELAQKFSADFRRVVSSKWYHELFPEFVVSPYKNSQTEVATTKGGYRLSVSIDGTITGRGADVIVVDDSMKPEDALSEKMRETTNRWYSNTLVSRLNNKKSGKILIVGQRVHQDDLSGTLINQGVRALVFSAIAEFDEKIPLGPVRFHHRHTGELLHPDREPLFVLNDLKRQMGTNNFQAQYQQVPIPPGGLMIQRDWIERYTDDDLQFSEGTIVQSWDTASKNGPNNDYSVCTTWLVTHTNRYYLLNVYRARLNYPDLKAQAIKLFKQLYDVDRVLIEDTGVGTALIAELSDLGIPAIGVTPDRDKLTRMEIQTAKFEAGHVFLPDEDNGDEWLADYETELFSFPGCRHDDQIDSTSQALAYEHSGFPMWHRGNVGC